MIDHLTKLFVVANYCDLEKQLKFKLARYKRDLESCEKALKDYKDFAFKQWLEQDKEANYRLLETRASNVGEEESESESAASLLPYQKDQSYQARVSELENDIKEAKDNMLPCFEEYETFVNSPFGSIASRINYNSYKRCQKLEKRIEHMFALKRRVFFLTFTFNDEALTRYTEKSLKKAVLAFVRKSCDFYIVNKDFGAQNARLHFHAIVVSKNNKIDVKAWSDRYGFMLYRVCGKRKRDQQNIKLYVTKLSRHTVKETTAKDERLIYCRAFALNGI